MVLCSTPKIGPHPGGSYGGQGGLSFYVGAKGREESQISHRKFKIFIMDGMILLRFLADGMLIYVFEKNNQNIYYLCKSLVTLRTSEPL